MYVVVIHLDNAYSTHMTACVVPGLLLQKPGMTPSFFLAPGRSLLPAMASSSTTTGRPCTSVSRIRQQRRDIVMYLWVLMCLGGAALEVGASIPLRLVPRAWIYQYREFTSVHLHCLCVHCIICFPCITIKMIVCSIV